MSLNLKDPTLLQSKTLIAGEWVDAASGKVMEITNPATGELVGTVPSVSAEEVRKAIEAAEVARHPWAAKTGKERSQVLYKWFNLMRENREDLAKILTAEQGKPLAEAMGEIDYAASFIEWFAEEAKRVYGDTIPGHQPDKRIVVMKQPIGVTACITPWNFPAAMITRKAGPALAVGCSMVIKPAPQTPLSAIALCVLAERAGVPAGILSCATGAAEEVGPELTSNPTIRKLSFTGSTKVGKLLMRECADTVKRTSMELGGNAPFIVFDDADLDAAVEGAIASKYRNAGQTCVCANRLFVQEGIHDAFVEALTARVKDLKVGDGFQSDTQIGPMIDQRAVEKVETLMADAVARGGEVTIGGERHTLGQTFYQPTVITGVTPEFQMFNEEIFGPVAPIVKFSDTQDMIDMANDTPYGLAAYFYAQNLSNVWRTAEALDFGIVGVNTGIISTELAPFGGVKESGTGREGSKYGIDDYLEMKYLCLSV